MDDDRARESSDAAHETLERLADFQVEQRDTLAEAERRLAEQRRREAEIRRQAKAEATAVLDDDRVDVAGALVDVGHAVEKLEGNLDRLLARVDALEQKQTSDADVRSVRAGLDRLDGIADKLQGTVQRYFDKPDGEEIRWPIMRRDLNG